MIGGWLNDVAWENEGSILVKHVTGIFDYIILHLLSNQRGLTGQSRGKIIGLNGGVCDQPCLMTRGYDKKISALYIYTGWWFGTSFIFPIYWEYFQLAKLFQRG